MTTQGQHTRWEPGADKVWVNAPQTLQELDLKFSNPFATGFKMALGVALAAAVIWLPVLLLMIIVIAGASS